MCYENENGNVIVESDETTQSQPQTQTQPTGKPRAVPKRKFYLTGQDGIQAALTAAFPNQDARVIVCNPHVKGAEAVVWIGATTESYNGGFFDVLSRKLNQYSREYTFVPAQH